MSTESPTENQQQVSIICRTLGRPELQQALQSISEQDYPQIEIVLVDAAGNDSLDYQSANCDRPIELVTSGAPLGRSAAANAGLDAARGQYILFLDDDDWLAANHISSLVEALQSNEEIGAAYSSTQKTDATGKNLGFVFEEDFDPILLMRDNYIPIHAILFESALLEHGCRFDEAFDIYEDWDFWLQLSQYTRFQHVDVISAFYREGGDSATAAEDVRLRYEADNLLGKGRAAIFSKWLPKWSGEQLNALIGRLDQSVLLVEQNEQIHAGLKRNAELQHELELRDMRIKELELQQNNLETQIVQQQQHSERHIGELEQRLNAIYASKSWKLMGPARRLGRALSNDKTPADDSDSER